MVKREFLVERQGKSFVLYAGLLDAAHAQGLKAIRTRLVQVPSDANNQTAIVTAEVETERGFYSGIGDASPANVSRAMLTSTIRLAETRAKARALRDAINVGVSAFEEIDGETGEVTSSLANSGSPRADLATAIERSTPTSQPPPEPTPIVRPSPAPARAVAASAPAQTAARDGVARPPTVDTGLLASPAQVKLIEQLAAEQAIPTEGLLKLCHAYGFQAPEHATKSQASRLITALKAGTASY